MNPISKERRIHHKLPNLFLKKQNLKTHYDFKKIPKSSMDWKDPEIIISRKTIKLNIINLSTY